MVDAKRVGGIQVGRVIPNAPSAFPQRERLFHTPPPWAGSGEVFFITITCTPRGANQLAREPALQVLREAFEHNMNSGNLWVHLLLAMPDHLHALLSFPVQKRMDAAVRNLKRFVAKTANITWQDGFFDHRLRNHENFEEKAHYIRMNPVRAGLVSQPVEWQYVWPAYEAPAAR